MKWLLVFALIVLRSAFCFGQPEFKILSDPRAHPTVLSNTCSVFFRNYGGGAPPDWLSALLNNDTALRPVLMGFLADSNRTVFNSAVKSLALMGGNGVVTNIMAGIPQRPPKDQYRLYEFAAGATLSAPADEVTALISRIFEPTNAPFVSTLVNSSLLQSNLLVRRMLSEQFFKAVERVPASDRQLLVDAENGLRDMPRAAGFLNIAEAAKFSQKQIAKVRHWKPNEWSPIIIENGRAVALLHFDQGAHAISYLLCLRKKEEVWFIQSLIFHSIS